MNVFSIIFSIVAAAVAGFSMFTSFDANVETQKLGASQKISELTSYTNPDDADSLPIVDSANAQTKRITWGNATSSLGTYFGGVYSPIFSTSAGLAGLLSDETGSGGGFVRATAPTITTPSMTTPTLDVGGADATGDMYYNGGSGVLTRLGIGAGTSYYLRSSAGGIPEWDNTGLLTNPQVASASFTSTTTFSATTTFSGPVATIGFGGTGEDGYLNITSGTTTVDCNYQPICVKNYTNIAISGSGVLAFSNPYNYGTIVILKSQGNTTISCTGVCIYLRNMGAAGGAAGGSGGGAGGTSKGATYVWDTAEHGASMTNPSAPGVVTAGAAYANTYLYTSTTTMLASRGITITPGSGGGGGQGARVISGNEAAGGAGGRGAGALILETSGTLVFSSGAIIDARGENGAAGASNTNGGVNTWAGGGGGGGAGGMVVALANFVKTNGGTISTGGGNGGNGGDTTNTGSGAGGNTGWSGSGGGGGGAYGGAGGAGGAGETGTDGGANGGSSGGGTGAGGGGGAGGNRIYNSAGTTSGGTGGTGGGNTIGIIVRNYFF